MDVLPPDDPNGSAGPDSGPRVTRPGFSVIARVTGIGAPFRLPAQDMANLTSRIESSQSNRPSSGENLISTNDRPNGLNTPTKILSPDRVQQASAENQKETPDKFLRKIMGNESTQVQS